MQKWEKFTKEELEEIIKTSNKYSEALEKLGYATHSANNKYIRQICEKYGFSLEHFCGTTLKDLTGKKFGRLTVLYRDLTKPKGHGHKAYWVCQCECGNTVSVKSHCLLSGETKSCGCFQKEQTSKAIKINLINQRFGALTVIKEAPSIYEPSGAIRTAWLCKCDCGNEVIVKTINLRSGDTKSCGCIKSAGEYRIEYILKELGIEYKREFSFPDLKTENNFLMRFDFAIFNNGELKYLIEYQGIGHYEEGKWLLPLKIRQERDNKKRKYCKEKQIQLIEIPYWDFNKIDENYIKEKLYECNYR